MEKKSLCVGVVKNKWRKRKAKYIKNESKSCTEFRGRSRKLHTEGTIHSAGVLCADTISFQELSVNLFICSFMCSRTLRVQLILYNTEKFHSGGQKESSFLTYNEATTMTVEKDEHNILWVGPMQLFFLGGLSDIFHVQFDSRNNIFYRTDSFWQHMRIIRDYSISSSG